MISSYKQLRELFIPPEKTPAGLPFGNPPSPVALKDAKVVVYGVPFDDSATFGKGTHRGPEAIRHVSGRQIETFVVDEGFDIYERAGIFDLGDLKIGQRLNKVERELLQRESLPQARRKPAIKRLEDVLKQFEILGDVTKFLHEQGKIPVMLGGEHTLSYWPLCASAREDLVVLHFDAHRDAKDEYMGMRMCHTTPMRRFLDYASTQAHKTLLVQIGIRQADAEEQAFAQKRCITVYPDSVRGSLDQVRSEIKTMTAGRNVYVTFDIDALDIAYTPCTGTPEPFGLTPEQVVSMFKAINHNAKLVGADMMEVAVKKGDFREATTAAQLLLRLLARQCVQNV